MLACVVVSCICLSHFLIVYHLEKRLFKILCSSINEYLGNSIDYYLGRRSSRPDPNTWKGREFRLSENFNHDDIEDLF